MSLASALARSTDRDRLLFRRGIRPAYGKHTSVEGARWVPTIAGGCRRCRQGCRRSARASACRRGHESAAALSPRRSGGRVAELLVQGCARVRAGSACRRGRMPGARTLGAIATEAGPSLCLQGARRSLTRVTRLRGSNTITRVTVVAALGCCTYLAVVASRSFIWLQEHVRTWWLRRNATPSTAGNQAAPPQATGPTHHATGPTHTTGPNSHWRRKNEKKVQKSPSNALVTGVVSAVVGCGIISLLVSLLITRVQNENSASQAAIGQQVQAAGQLEAAANALYQGTTNAYNFQLLCTKGGHNTWEECAAQALQVYPSYNVAVATLNTDGSNIADRSAAELANQLGSESADTISARSSADATKLWYSMVTTYAALIGRCGQLVQAR